MAVRICEKCQMLRNVDPSSCTPGKKKGFIICYKCGGKG